MLTLASGETLFWFACCQGNHHSDDDKSLKVGLEDQEVGFGVHPPRRSATLAPVCCPSKVFQAQRESSVPVLASWHDNR